MSLYSTSNIVVSKKKQKARGKDYAGAPIHVWITNILENLGVAAQI